jgi:HEAT repeat protein
MSLERTQDQRAVPYAIKALRDENKSVRWHAVLTLNTLQDPQSISPLCETLADPDPLIRHYAIIALGKFGDMRAMRVLQREQRKSHNNQIIKAAAAQAIDLILSRADKSG